MPDIPFHIRPVRTSGDLDAITQLFDAYASTLGIDLSYQDFATELTTLPGKYAPPSGALLLACGGDGAPAHVSEKWTPVFQEGHAQTKEPRARPESFKSGRALGCVGLRPITPGGCCEMKRLYVAPAARGLGLGRALVEAVIGEAVRIGYCEMRLDTLPTMAEAISLYRAAGFAPIAPYYDTPIAGTLFFARALGRARATSR